MKKVFSKSFTTGLMMAMVLVFLSIVVLPPASAAPLPTTTKIVNTTAMITQPVINQHDAIKKQDIVIPALIPALTGPPKFVAFNYFGTKALLITAKNSVLVVNEYKADSTCINPIARRNLRS
jgi:hypothetical protein